MSQVTEERFCPVCSQIVPIEIDGISVKISPSRKILLHSGCAEKIVKAYEEWLIEKVE
jgi:hypothetical protein